MRSLSNRSINLLLSGCSLTKFCLWALPARSLCRSVFVLIFSSLSALIFARSGFKGACRHDFLRRFLESFRAALRTGTDPAQEVKRVDPGAMAVAPRETKGIISNKFHVHPLESRWDASLKEEAPAGEFFNARGARTVFAQVPGRVRAEVPVIPGDIRSKRVDALDARRYEVWQEIPLPSNTNILYTIPKVLTRKALSAKSVTGANGV